MILVVVVSAAGTHLWRQDLKDGMIQAQPEEAAERDGWVLTAFRSAFGSFFSQGAKLRAEGPTKPFLPHQGLQNRNAY